jgi:hypothetical protein
MSRVEWPCVFVAWDSGDVVQDSARLTKRVPCYFLTDSLVSFESPVSMRLPQEKIFSREEIACYVP